MIDFSAAIFLPAGQKSALRAAQKNRAGDSPALAVSRPRRSPALRGEGTLAVGAAHLAVTLPLCRWGKESPADGQTYGVSPFPSSLTSLTSMCLDFISWLLGSFTVSTPWRNSASTWSSFTVVGSGITRRNEP